jgi:hypothetical protein
MRFPLIFSIIFLCSTFSFGQTVSRIENESTEQFAKRFQPEHSEIVHKVIESKWNATPVIIAFYNQTYKLPKQNDPDQQDQNSIIAKLYVQGELNQYRIFLIDTIDTEGGEPQIENVFFANADADKAKELVLLVSWEQRHYDINGTLCATYVYDDLLTNPQMKLMYMKKISKKLDGGFDGSNEGKTVKAKFKTSESIKSELKRLGFN